MPPPPSSVVRAAKATAAFRRDAAGLDRPAVHSPSAAAGPEAGIRAAVASAPVAGTEGPEVGLGRPGGTAADG